MRPIERAILSCYDKSGLVEFATVLREYGVDLVATEGTRDALAKGGIESVELAEFTGQREMLGGRVKSLHPKVHAGLMGVRDNKIHQEEMQTFGFTWVDMLVVNLPPVAEFVANPSLTVDEVVEQVDIGGVAMIRSGAKNFRYVTVITDPDRYASAAHELKERDGQISFETRFRLAQDAFAATAAYDATFADYLAQCEPRDT